MYAINKYLDILNKELKHNVYQFQTININSLDIYNKCYTIHIDTKDDKNNKGNKNSKYCTDKYTLYEYCIILQKYKYII